MLFGTGNYEVEYIVDGKQIIFEHHITIPVEATHFRVICPNGTYLNRGLPYDSFEDAYRSCQGMRRINITR